MLSRLKDDKKDRIHLEEDLTEQHLPLQISFGLQSSKGLRPLLTADTALFQLRR